jgi:multidrug efflux pump subunit AcrA (membrane-fusion protein)
MKNIFQKNTGTAKSSNLISVLIISSLILPVLFTGCERIKKAYSKKNKTETVKEVPVFAVNTIPAAKGQIQDYIKLTGDIVAGSTVDVYSEAAGKVYALHVSVGSRVNRGAPVATIDPSRPGMTFKHSVAAAPISGIVVALPAQVGMTISQAVPLARIAGGGALEIKLNAAERFISKMELDLPCEITLDAWPGEIFRGSINEISPTVDLASRTMELRVNVNNPGSKLKQGMFAKVRIITEQKNNIVKIPVQAVINRFGEQYVFVVEKDPENPEFTIVKKKNIVPGITIDGIMEIQDGLTPDEEIVIRGQTLLDEGSRVNIIERLAPLGTN